MAATEFTFEGYEGQTIAGYRWDPAGAPKAAVQIAHGAAEHAMRYDRVASRLAEHGYVVYANDHRAHGRTADEHGTFGVARPGGWRAIVEDLHVLTDLIRRDHPDLPIVFFGHSMGSMMGQEYIRRWGDGLTGAVLSGTTGGLALDDATMQLVTALGEGDGADEPSEVFAAMFAGFNEPFTGDDATGFEWLSRDADEVQKYVDDPWSGFALSNGYVADMLVGTDAMWQPELEARIRKDLPIYVVGGDQDPVGGPEVETVHQLVERYEAHGIGPITLRLYPGGRHEMLNETNRDEVMGAIAEWLDAKIGV